MTKEQNLIKEYLEWQNIPFHNEIDLGLLMKLSKGQMNPANALGFWIYPNNPQLKTLITGFHQLIDWVSLNGARQC